MKRRSFFLLLGLFAVSGFFFPNEPVAQTNYYEGKKFTIIVGTTPGGGVDRMARLIAKHLSKHIPGKPTIIVENMPGAGGLIAANHIFNTAKPDGLAIATFQRGMPFAQVMKLDGVRFDLTKFVWIGSASVEATVLAVRTDLPYKSLDDIRNAKNPIHLASGGPETSGAQFPSLLKEFAGFSSFKPVYYSSSAEEMLAVERKEADGRAGTFSALRPFVERGLIRPFVRGRVSEPGIENLPVDEDLATDNKGKIIMSMRSAPDLIGRPYVAPPKTPPDTAKILRDAFTRIMNDPEFKDESKKILMTPQYVPAEECLKVINHILNQPEDIVKEFSKYIKF